MHYLKIISIRMRYIVILCLYSFYSYASIGLTEEDCMDQARQLLQNSTDDTRVACIAKGLYRNYEKGWNDKVEEIKVFLKQSDEKLGAEGLLELEQRSSARQLPTDSQPSMTFFKASKDCFWASSTMQKCATGFVCLLVVASVCHLGFHAYLGIKKRIAQRNQKEN